MISIHLRYGTLQNNLIGNDAIKNSMFLIILCMLFILIIIIIIVYVFIETIQNNKNGYNHA